MITEPTLASIESDVLQKAEVLAFFLRSISAEDPEAGKRLLKKIVTRLEEEVARPANPQQTSGGMPPSKPVLVSSRPQSRDEIEEFILENLETSAQGLSVQEIYDRFDEAQIVIRRQTLVVRLHRMVAAGKLTVRAHGHYTLSETQRRMHKVG
jgi:hypothetical protein